MVGAEPITDVDVTAADVLDDLGDALAERGVTLVFAELHEPVRRKLERLALTHAVDAAHYFPTIDAAVAAFRAETGADWAVPPRPDTAPDSQV